MALETRIMDQQAETRATFPPFAQKLIDRGKLEGKLEGKRETLLRLLTRAGITFTEEDRARVEACAEPATLDRWVGVQLLWSGGISPSPRPPCSLRASQAAPSGGTEARAQAHLPLQRSHTHRWVDNVLSAKAIDDVLT